MQDESDSQDKITIERKPFVSTRHRDAEPDTFDPNVPRLGRRESEPHSAEITYLHDVLTTNFPDDRTMWDLHHYFEKERMKIDVQFDISYFKGLKIPYTLSSYHADQFNNKVPTMVINILSKSTWRSDIAEKIDFCRFLAIPLYVIFPSFHVSIDIYKPPFFRAYILQSDGAYKIQEVRKVAINIEGVWDLDAAIDVSDIVPFRLGLKERDVKHQKEEPLYRLVLIAPKKNQILLTEIEEKEQLIREQSQKIMEQSQKITEQSQKIDKLEAENLKLKNRLEEK